MIRNYDSSTEKELVLLYSKGDTSALNVLLTRIRPFVFSVVIGYIGDRDRSEDYTQDILCKVQYNIDNKKYIPNGNFYSWIRCVSRNYVGDDLRHKKRLGIGYFLNVEVCQDLKNYFLDDLEEKLCTEGKLDFIKNNIHHLPYNQMVIIQYRYFDGLSFKDIASKLNISINTALGRCRYGINNLRKLYNKYERSYIYETRYNWY